MTLHATPYSVTEVCYKLYIEAYVKVRIGKGLEVDLKTDIRWEQARNINCGILDLSMFLSFVTEMDAKIIGVEIWAYVLFKHNWWWHWQYEITELTIWRCFAVSPCCYHLWLNPTNCTTRQHNWYETTRDTKLEMVWKITRLHLSCISPLNALPSL